MSEELSIRGALPFKRCPEVNIRIISLALHRVITIGILSTHTLNLDCYPWTNLLDNTHVFPWIRYSIILRVKITSIPVRLRILSLYASTGVNSAGAALAATQLHSGHKLHTWNLVFWTLIG
jgi:hypothetical protein